MLATAFADYSDEYNLHPERKRDCIDTVVEKLCDPLPQEAYTAGFAGSQDTYAAAVEILLDALYHWEDVIDAVEQLNGN
jgi:putative glutathione S-transferase